MCPIIEHWQNNKRTYTNKENDHLLLLLETDNLSISFLLMFVGWLLHA